MNKVYPSMHRLVSSLFVSRVLHLNFLSSSNKYTHTVATISQYRVEPSMRVERETIQRKLIRQQRRYTMYFCVEKRKKEDKRVSSKKRRENEDDDDESERRRKNYSTMMLSTDNACPINY